MDSRISLLEIEGSELYTVYLRYAFYLENLPDTISADLSSSIRGEVSTLISNYDDIIQRVIQLGPGIRIPVLDPLSYNTLRHIQQMCQARWGTLPMNNNNIVHTPPRVHGGKGKTRRAKPRTK
jgi:hypothetical protein